MVKIQKKVRKKYKLPRNPRKGQIFTRTMTIKKQGKRKITWEATGEKGFDKWRIIKNEAG